MIELVHLGTVGSTNDEALARARARDVPAPIAVRADEQTAGRGRRGRAWSSPPGGVWLSLAWPCAHPPDRYGAASVLAALAAVDALLENRPAAARDAGSDDLVIKWPNDLLVEGRKLGGVLCEHHPAPSGTSWLVVGVGLNARVPSSIGDPTAIGPAGYTDTLGISAGPAPIADTLIRALAGALKTLEEDPRACSASAQRRLQDRLAWRGEAVRITGCGVGDLLARLEGIDEALRLVLVDERGGVRRLFSGEIARVRRMT